MKGKSPLLPGNKARCRTPDLRNCLLYTSNAAEAADLIQDRSTVAIDGFIGFCLADDILTAIEKRYIREDHPRDLSVVNVAGLGGDGQQRGINHFAHRGLMRRFLCSNLSLAPKLYPLIMDNVFPTFMMPQGVLSHMMRAIAAHRPGIISQVGMKTFVDPRIDGGKINDAAKASEEEIVQLLNLNGEEYLFYPAFPLEDVYKRQILGRFANTSV